MHFPGCGKNLAIARATPAPAWSINASTSTPRAKAASSASRICAEVKIGESNQPSRSFEVAFASDPAAFDELFFLEDLLCERFDRERLEFCILVWSMYGCSGMLSAVAIRVGLDR